MYEKANKLWNDMKLDKHLFEEKYKMKMNELKLLAIRTKFERFLFNLSWAFQRHLKKILQNLKYQPQMKMANQIVLDFTKNVLN